MQRDFILESARKLKEWENTPRVFADPYSDMTSEEKSRLLVYQQELLAGKEREIAELHAELDRLIESQKEEKSGSNGMDDSLHGRDGRRTEGIEVVQCSKREGNPVPDGTP